MKMGEQLTECMRNMSAQNCEFKAALNILIKYEIQCLLQRLSDTGEEAIIITTSVSDTYHGYYGSVKGLGFLHSTQKKLSSVKDEFLKYCADQSIVDDDCRNEFQEVSHVDHSPSGTVSDISPQHSKGEQYSFQSHAGDTHCPDWSGKEQVTNHMFCFSGKHPVTSSSNNQDLGHSMLEHCNASTMDDPLDFTWKIEKHEHFSGDSNKTVSNFQHAKSVIKQAFDQNNVYSKSTLLNTNSSVCTYQDKKHPASSAASSASSSQLLKDDSDTSGVDFSLRTIELEDEKAKAGRNRNIGLTECICSEIDCKTKTEDLCEDCEDCKNKRVTNIFHDKYRSDVYLGKDLSQHCEETKPKSIQVDHKKIVTTDECKDSGALRQFLMSTEDWDSQVIFKKNTLWDRKMQTDGHMFGAQLDISLSSNDDYENDINPQDLVHVKKEPVQFEEYNVMSPMKNELEVKVFPDRMSSEPLHSPIQLKFSCKICRESFKNRQFRDLHVKRHWSSHKFNCNFCSKGFDIESDFESHQNEHKGPVFQCDLCGYRCSREFRMKSHKEICGKPSQIFSCPYCNKPFAAKRYMRIHMKSHDSRNVNICPFCQITYPLKNSLLKHIKKKHGSQLNNC